MFDNRREQALLGDDQGKVGPVEGGGGSNPGPIGQHVLHRP